MDLRASFRRAITASISRLFSKCPECGDYLCPVWIVLGKERND
jgi:hypothetical protein